MIWIRIPLETGSTPRLRNNKKQYYHISSHWNLRNYFGWPDFLKTGPPSIEDGRPLHFPTHNNSKTFLRDRIHISSSLLYFQRQTVHKQPPLPFDKTSPPILADVLLCNFLEYINTLTERCVSLCSVVWSGICSNTTSISFIEHFIRV